MLKKMVSYLMHNREVVTLVANGRASLLGVTSKQQQALINVMGQDELPEDLRTQSPQMYWYA